MKSILTILIFLSALLQLQAQVKNHKPESLAKRTLQYVDTTKLKIDNTNKKVDSQVQAARQKLEAKSKKLLGSSGTKATEVDSIEIKRKMATDKIRLQGQVAQHKFDSINQINNRDKKRFEKVDSAQMKIEGGADRVITNTQAVDGKIDSASQRLTDGVESKLDVIDSANQKISQAENKIKQVQNHYADSLNSVINKYEQTLHINKLTNAIDSLKRSSLPYDKYTNKLDSIRNVDPLWKTKSGITQAQSKIQNLSNEPKTKIDEKLNLLSKESGGKGNLPAGVNLPNTDLNKITDKVSGNVKLPDTDLKLDKTLPSLDQPSVANPDLNQNLKFPKDLGKTPDLDKLSDLKKGTGEVTNVTGKVTGYTEDIKNIEKGDVEKVKTLKEDALTKLPVKDELTEIQKQDRLIKEQQAKLESFKNPEEYKKQTLARSKEIVAQQMAVYETQIQKSVDKLSKYQGKMGTILGKTKDLPKKRDILKKLKMHEKFVPGLTLQIQKPGAWLVDINPSLRYRLTSYWSIGAGWNERVIFGNYPLGRSQARVFGVRSFTEVVIFRGLSFRLDAEDMNAFIIPRQQTQDTGERLWIWSYMAGIKKEFSFVPKVIGNVQFMYNVYSSNANNPYPTRFNVRFGFEYMLRRKLKK